jgi:hypothetical protein
LNKYDLEYYNETSHKQKRDDNIRYLTVQPAIIDLLCRNKDKRTSNLRNYAFFQILKARFVNSRVYPHNSNPLSLSKLTGVSVNTAKRILRTLIHEGTIIRQSNGTLILRSFYHLKKVSQCKEYTVIPLNKNWSVSEMAKALCFAYLKETSDREEYIIKKRLSTNGAADEADCSATNAPSDNIQLSCKTMADFLHVTPSYVSKLKKIWTAFGFVKFKHRKEYLGKKKDLPKFIFDIKGVYENERLGTVYRQYCDSITYTVK